MTLIVRRTRTRQPQPPTPVADPWRRSLLWASSATDLLDLVANTRSGTGFTVAQAEGRKAAFGAICVDVAYQSAGTTTLPRWKTTSINVGTGDVSILCVAAIGSSANYGNSLTNHGGSNQWRFQTSWLANGTSSGAASSGALSVLTYDGAWSSVGAAGLCDGNLHAYLFRRYGSTLELWVDGTLRASASSTARNISGSKTSGLAIGWDQGDSPDDGIGWYAAAHQWALGAMWGAVVDPAISANPWQIFAPECRIFPTAAAGGGGGDITVALSGSSVLFSLGSFGLGSSVPLSGAFLTSAAGTLAPSSAIALSGSEVTTSAGAIPPSTTIALSGTEVTTIAGTIIASGGGNVTVALAGEAVSTLLGTLIPSVSVALTGDSSTVSAGTLIPGQTIALSGSSATISTGTISLSSSISLSGSAVSVLAGTLSVAGSVTITLKAGSWLRYKKLI